MAQPPEMPRHGKDDDLLQTVRVSDILPAVTCVEPTEARFVHHHVFHGAVGGYGLAAKGIQLAPGATIVDVGSNIGNFAMWALHALQGDARLVLMEPVPVLAACLRANVERYSVPGKTRATVLNLGCTRPDKVGPASMAFCPGYTLLSSLQAWGPEELGRMAAGLQRFTGREDADELRRVVDLALTGSSARDVAVRLTTLSEALAGLGLEQIDLLKIDAVKAELDILAGTSDDDWAKVRQVVVEVHLGGDPTRLARVTALLRERGFTSVRTGAPGTPTFLAFKQYGMLRPAGAGASGGGSSRVGAGAGCDAASGQDLLPRTTSAGPGLTEQEAQEAVPSYDHMLCAVYATR